MERVQIDWPTAIGDLESLDKHVRDQLAAGNEVVLTEIPYAADEPIRTVGDWDKWYGQVLGDPYEAGEHQARAKRSINPPSFLKDLRLAEFVIGYADKESGGLAGNKASLYAELGQRFKLPKQPFLVALEGASPEAIAWFHGAWRS